MNQKQSKQTLKFTRFGLPILIGLVVSQVALIIVYATVVGDPCQYHLPHEKIAPWYIKIFFPIPEANFHPEPGWLIECVFTLGGCLSAVFFRLLYDKYQLKVVEDRGER